MSIEKVDNTQEYQNFKAQETSEFSDAARFESIPAGDQAKPEVRRSLNVFRSKIMRAVMLGGYLSIVEACGGFKENESAKIPLVNVNEIVKDPGKYTEGPMLRTQGYPVFDHQERTPGRVPSNSIDLDGNLNITDYEDVEFVKHYYNIYEGVEKGNDSGLIIVLDRGKESPTGQQFSNTHPQNELKGHKYSFIGRLRQDKDKFVLEVVQIKKIDEMN